MKRIVVAVLGVCLSSFAQPATAQSARHLLDRENPLFCGLDEVWVRAATVVRDQLPEWKLSAAQRAAVEVRFSDQSLDFAHPDRVQLVCFATVTVSAGGSSRSLRTRFDATPMEQPDSFRLVATDGSDLIRFLSGIEVP